MVHLDETSKGSLTVVQNQQKYGESDIGLLGDYKLLLNNGVQKAGGRASNSVSSSHTILFR